MIVAWVRDALVLALFLVLAWVPGESFAWGDGAASVGAYWGTSSGPLNFPVCNGCQHPGEVFNPACVAHFGEGAAWTSRVFEADGSVQSPSATNYPQMYQGYGKKYLQCSWNSGFGMQTDPITTPDMEVWIWPGCDAGVAGKALWPTTIATGSTGLSIIPQGSPPSTVCVSWCQRHGDSLTYRAWVEPGHVQVGDKLWVELNTTSTASVCNPETFAVGQRGESLPGFVCQTSDQSCIDGGGNGSGGGGAGLDATDKEHLAQAGQGAMMTAGSLFSMNEETGELDTAYNRLKAISDAIAPSIEGDPQDCSITAQCTGNAAACTEFAAARKSYCMLHTNDEEKFAGQIAAFEDGIAKDDDALRAGIKGGVINIAEHVNDKLVTFTAQCPAPIERTLSFGPIQKTFRVEYTAFCDLAPYIRLALLVTAGIVGVRIFMGRA